MPEASHTDWITPHGLTFVQQVQDRRVGEDGTEWLERQVTGKALVYCNCGYTTGWIDKADLPDLDQAMAEHHGQPLLQLQAPLPVLRAGA